MGSGCEAPEDPAEAPEDPELNRGLETVLGSSSAPAGEFATAEVS